MAVQNGVYVTSFLVISLMKIVKISGSKSTCISPDPQRPYWSTCYYGCCGNTTLNGYGTMPCCKNEDTPQYAYLLLAIGLLVPCGICLMILRRTGERCRQTRQPRRSRRNEDLEGRMPTFGDRRLMISTIANMIDIYSHNERRRNSGEHIITPPSYDDAVKESGEDYKPPAYTEVLKMSVDGSDQTHRSDDDPPSYQYHQISDDAIISQQTPSTSGLSHISTDSSLDPSTSMTQQSTHPQFESSTSSTLPKSTHPSSGIHIRCQASNTFDNEGFSSDSENDRSSIETAESTESTEYSDEHTARQEYTNETSDEHTARQEHIDSSDDQTLNQRYVTQLNITTGYR